MIADIRKHLDRTPFIPFTIRTADGREYPVPSVDHIWLPPQQARVFVADDEGLSAILPGLLISGIVVPTDATHRGEAG
jgi:hypothetical protein